MRTPFLSDYLKNVSSLNRELRCSDFVYEQFIADHGRTIRSQPGAFTGDLFPGNAFSRRFYFAMGKVPAEVEAVRAAGRRNAFVVNYSLIEIFQHDVIRLCETVLRRTVTFPSNTTYFNALHAFLGAPATWLSGNDTATFDFLRCRRNCIVHRNGTANAAFEIIRRQKGTLLNREWKKRRHIQKLDFKAASVVDFDVDEIIDVLNISRDLIASLDRAVCSALPRNRVLSEVAASFRAERKDLAAFDQAAQLRKFTTYARIRYGLTPTPTEATQSLFPGS